MAIYVQTNLVSDIAGLATAFDPHLVNPWGVSFREGSPGNPGSPFWVSNQGSNSTTLYSVTGSIDISPPPPVPVFTVNIPTTGTGPQGPTGQVSNTNPSSFHLTDPDPLHQGAASFIFANLNGTISAWNGSLGTNGSTAHIEVTTAGAVYTGLAVNEAHTMLYAANTRAGTIDVFDSTFHSVELGDLGNHAFRTPGQIEARGLVPFNVTDIGGHVYVTYAPAGRAAQISAGEGDGAVAIFDESGNLEPHGVLLGGPQTPLAAPWGVAIAPDNWGQFSGDLLVGNFSFQHSEINAFDPQNHQLVGTIPITLPAGTHAGRSLDPDFRGRRPGRQPEHPLLHRRHRRRDAWSVRRNRERAASWGIDADAFRGFRISPEAAACAGETADRIRHRISLPKVDAPQEATRGGPACARGPRATAPRFPPRPRRRDRGLSALFNGHAPTGPLRRACARGRMPRVNQIRQGLKCVPAGSGRNNAPAATAGAERARSEFDDRRTRR